MYRLAFKMRLHPGSAAEYKKRHDNIWPELTQLLKKARISDYSIFLDDETNILFAVLKADELDAVERLPTSQLMKDWWSYMSDIMETNPDYSPVSRVLSEMFYMA